MSHQNPKSCRGFTLVELLVVVAIIAILSTIGLLYYGDLQKRARDSARITYLEGVGKALEINKGPESYEALQADQLTSFTTIDLAGNAYCIAPNIPPDPSFSIPWASTCPAGFEAISPGVPAGDFTAWKICTYLENPPSGQPNVYCRTGSL